MEMRIERKETSDEGCLQSGWRPCAVEYVQLLSILLPTKPHHGCRNTFNAPPSFACCRLEFMDMKITHAMLLLPANTAIVKLTDIQRRSFIFYAK